MRRGSSVLLVMALVVALVGVRAPREADARVDEGALDRIERTGGSLVVHGWALGDAGGVTVHVYVDGVLAGAGRTGVSRPDVAATHGAEAGASGFAVRLEGADDQYREVCAWAVIDGSGRLVGCRAAPAGYPPIGALDRVDRRDGRLVVWGWAADGDDLVEGPPVHVYVDGVLAGAGRTGVERPDVAAVFAPLGDTTGYGIVVDGPVDDRAEVCAWAVDVGGSSSRRLGCRFTGVPGGLLSTTRVVAHYGSGVTPLLGVAGEGTPAEAAARVARVADEWASLGTPTVPAFDYIAAVATRSPGPDGNHSNPGDLAEIRRYLDAIRGVGGLLILDIQPGSSEFIDQVRPFEELLREPEVGLALDPEWRMPPGVVPGSRIGSVGVDEINVVGDYLASLVRDEGLPPKIFMIHQFTGSMIRDRERLVHHPELATVIQLDGFGGRAVKIDKYRSLRPEPPFFPGFKLFLDEDIDLMSPSEVDAALDPDPAFISYQ